MEAFFWRLWRSSSWLRLLLLPLSLPWAAVVWVRNFLFDRGLLAVFRPEAFVISVGNITVGGTGKTPLLIALGKELERRGIRYTILTRGYKSGDEAKLLAEKLPQAEVIIDADRVRGAKRVSTPVLLIDDGLQRRDIARDLEIVCLDEKDPLGGSAFLPAGFLRDTPRSLRRADFLVGPQNARVRKYTEAPIVTPSKKIFVEGALAPFGLFAAVADPERIQMAAKALGLNIVSFCALPDHAQLSQELLERVAKRAKAAGAERLLCTEKDLVKIQGLLPLPVSVLKLELEGIEPLLARLP